MKRSDYVPGLRVSLVREPSSLALTQCSTPTAVAAIVRSVITTGDEREHFLAVLLDSRSKIKGVVTVSIGTLTASLVHPREVFRPAIVAGSAGIIIAHNHPSGDSQPSPEDQEVTRRLVKAGAIIGIPIIDHVVIGEGSYYSFRDNGKL